MKKNKSKSIGLIFLIILLVSVFSLNTNETKINYNEINNNNNTDEIKETIKQDNSKEDIKIDNKEVINKELKIHYIDVEQGDAIFIELPNNMTMLIDAGEANKGELVLNYIKNLGYKSINFLVGTHPHTDHIGGLATIINNLEIEKIYMPKALSTSKTYENLLTIINNKGLKVNTAKAGINIYKDDNLNIDIIAPNSESYSNLNNYSVVIKINYLNKKFLFMGDAETLSENEISTDVSADVVKVGHHGSDSSSGQTFVNKVKPKYAIIMVGEDNKYDHPYQMIIDRWKNIGATIYRTDINGNIIVTSDGNSIEVSTFK